LVLLVTELNFLIGLLLISDGHSALEDRLVTDKIHCKYYENFEKGMIYMKI
jgi:hypothetical protein